MARLQGSDRVRGRARGDQDGTVLQPLPRPAERALRFIRSGHDALGIKMQHRHQGLGILDLLQGGLRTTAGKTRHGATDRRANIGGAGGTDLP